MAWDGIADVLSKLRARYPAFGSRMSEVEAVARWEQAVGPGIAKHARPVRVDDTVLYVAVDHPIWRAELQARKRQILERLGEPITDLFFVDPRNR